MLPDAILDPTTLARYTIAVKSTMFAGFSMLMYDHLITIGDEVELIWKKPKSAVFALFVLNRYIGPCVIAVDIFDKISPMKHSIMFCKAWILLQSYLSIICYLSSHAVVAIRVNALHNGQITIKRLLWIGGISYALSTFAILTAAYPAIIALVKTSTSKGACVSKIPSYLWVAWMPTVVFETTLFVLTVYPVLLRCSRKASYSVIYASLFLDGAIYFVIVAACAIVSLVIWAQAPPTLIAVSRPLSTSIATIAGSRLILNLRRRVSAESEGAFAEHKSQGPGVSGPGFEFVVHSRDAQSAPGVEYPL